MELYWYLATVDEVIDGDTLAVSIDVGFSLKYSCHVRLNGINTPESRSSNAEEKKAGLAAKDYVKDWISKRGSSIKINTIKDKNEKFGRLLAEVYDSQGLDCLNNDLISEKLARPYSGKGDKTWEEFKEKNK